MDVANIPYRPNRQSPIVYRPSLIAPRSSMPNDNTNIRPHLVHTHDVQLDTDYTQWLVELKARYRSAQIKAAVRVNAEKLLFNWQLGRDLVIKKAESRWGEGIVEQLSLDLQAEFPNDRGFSARNLWDMKKWYLYYTTADAAEKLQQLVAEFPYVFAFPLALATYNGIKVSDVLPSEELLRQRVRQLEQELRLSRKLIHKLTEDDDNT